MLILHALVSAVIANTVLCTSCATVFGITLPWRCHGISMLLPWHCHAQAMLLPCNRIHIAMVLPCYCHAIAMHLPCFVIAFNQIFSMP